MSRTILLINHPTSKRDDRVSRLLAERGYRLDWRCPGQGDGLPEVDGEHVAAVVYGGPESANDGDDKPYIGQEIDWIADWAGAGRPFLGICLGAQLLARAQGARVARHPEGLHEIGYVEIAPGPEADGFLDRRMHVFHWHKEGFELPTGAELLAVGPTFENQAYRLGPAIYGIQFHPEVTPHVLARWCEEAAHMLDAPGAQDAASQKADAQRHDAPLEHWLDGFLDTWLAEVDEQKA